MSTKQFIYGGALLFSSLIITAVSQAYAAQSTPNGLESLDIGVPGVSLGSNPGTTTPAGDGYDVTTNSRDTWGDADGFRFLYTQRTGDFDAVVRVEKLLGGSTNLNGPGFYAKAGLMARETLDPGSRNLFLLVTPAQGANWTSTLKRTVMNGEMGDSNGKAGVSYPNAWLRLARTGDTFFASRSVDGLAWQLLDTVRMEMPRTIYLGLATSSHSQESLKFTTTASYRNIQGVSAAAVSPTQNLLLNGDFEFPGFTTPPFSRSLSDGDATSLLGWIIADDGIGQAPYLANIGEPKYANTVVHQGAYGVFLNQGSSVRTTFPAVSNTLYELSFWLTPYEGQSHRSQAPLVVRVAGLSTNIPPTSGWNYYTVQFRALSTDLATQLEFLNPSPAGDCRGYGLDEVAIESLPRNRAEPQVFLHSADPNLLVLGNHQFYEIAIRKNNGSIAYIKDKATGQNVSAGSRYECLWDAAIPQSPYSFGGCGYSASGANHFSYAWDEGSATLQLNYTADPSATSKAWVTVWLTLSPHAWFDLRLQLVNGWGTKVSLVMFPCDLLFTENEMQQAYLPLLPGVALGTNFFTQQRSYACNYPGWPGVFADFEALRNSRGQLAIYSLNANGPIAPAQLGFTHDPVFTGRTYMRHSFLMDLPHGQNWTSPTVRVRVGEEVFTSLRAWRVDNGVAHFQSLAEKLGSKGDQLFRSALLKADAVEINKPFSQYDSIFAKIPAPALLHPVAFQPRGYDENNPDFLPPDAKWGSTASFATMMLHAHTNGLLVMPYINPTRWDDQSPTLRQLPASVGISDLAVLDAYGTPRYETYDNHGGYVVCPQAPFVRQRLAQLISDMTTQVQSDLLYEDQVGVWTFFPDYNPAAPNSHSFLDGWLEHTRLYRERLLMAQLGYDRMVETEVGFHGTILSTKEWAGIDQAWGTNTWSVLPMAAIMFRDKVLLYQHDLDPDTMVRDYATLGWDLAMGYQLSYDLHTGGVDSPWLAAVCRMQQRVLGNYAGERLLHWTLTNQLSISEFETHTVWVNQRTNVGCAVGPHVLAPGGFLVTNLDQNVSAGLFTQYNKTPLYSGAHLLVEERLQNAILLRQLQGGNTAVAVRNLANWRTNEPLVGHAFMENGELIDTTVITNWEDYAFFYYQNTIATKAVGFYVITSTTAPRLRLVNPQAKNAKYSFELTELLPGIVHRIERATNATPDASWQTVKQFIPSTTTTNYSELFYRQTPQRFFRVRW